MSNQVATNQPVNTTQVLEMAKGDFNNVAIDKKVAWEKEFNFAMQLLGNNKMLDGVAWNNPQSLRNSIINVSAIGISLNPANKHAYLVPRDNKVCLDISYMGLLHLAMTGGSIKWGQCKLVMEGDEYRNNGLDKAPTHNFNPFDKERTVIIGAYCTVKTTDGSYLTDEMSIAEINEIKDKCAKGTNSKYSPWVNFFGEMARKTVVKRASKYWPAVERLNDAIEYLNTEGGEGIELEPAKGTTRPGMNPEILPIKLKNVYDLIREAYEAEDFQCVCEMLDQFSTHEEQIPVWKCFASNERTAISKFKKEEYTPAQDLIKVEYLNEEELTALCKQFNFD